jgi:hypothetical protein
MKAAITKKKSATNSSRTFWENIERLYSKIIQPQSVIFACAGLLVFIVASWWLHPTLKQRVFAPSRQTQFDVFVSEVKSANSLNLRAFWEFREFFSPGSFKINEEVLSVAETLVFKDQLLKNSQDSQYSV